MNLPVRSYQSMPDAYTPTRPVALTNHRGFWYWHLGFWVFLSIISFFTLTLWYSQQSWPYVFHTIAQAVIGLMATALLHKGLLHTWNKPTSMRVALVIGQVLGVSLLWTIGRMELFIQMTGEPNIWGDFGGWYFGGIVIFISWTALFHGIQYYQLLQNEHRVMLRAEADAREEQLKRMKAQAIARDAQIKMLRYQLNPHFLCNTLNAINGLVECEQNEKAQSMTVQLSNFLRHSLDNIPDTKITLESELNALNLYLQIEKTRFDDRLRLDFNIEPEALKGQVPSLLLQPIIENSMKHAIAQAENGGTITLQAKVEGDKLVLTIRDTGSGIKIGKSKIQSTTGRGVGLRNTDERLKVLYEGNYTFSLNTLPQGGLQTTITIPFEPLPEA